MKALVENENNPVPHSSKEVIFSSRSGTKYIFYNSLHFFHLKYSAIRIPRLKSVKKNTIGRYLIVRNFTRLDNRNMG